MVPAPPSSREPLVLIPGVQGHHEWMASTIEALAVYHPVVTFSLDVARGPGAFDQWCRHIDRQLDRQGAARAALVGVSFGGLIALQYAALRPERVTRLVLVSTPAPAAPADARIHRYLRHPRAWFPVFTIGAAGRLVPEIRAAFPGWRGRTAFALRHAGRVLRWPMSASRSAGWVREWSTLDLAAVARRVTASTLVITGEPELDRVVPVAGTLEYLRLIPGARHVVLERTGHLGILSRPAAFARAVADFVA